MRFLLTLILIFYISSSCLANEELENWQQIVDKARGQKIYFNGWGGMPAINDYIRWAAKECKKQYDIDVVHVKVQDVSETVSRVLAEKSAGREKGGSVDLLWINGENFRTMKSNELLMPVQTSILPNARFIDWKNKPSTKIDFSVPVDDLEVPWGMAQLVFMYDGDKLVDPPRTMPQLLSYLNDNPGKFTYPAPPSFYGTTFLKQVLLENIADKSILQQPVEDSYFDEVSAPIWEYLDKLHPLMWQNGKYFVSGAPALLNLLDNGEVFIAFSFNPGEADRAIKNGEIPASVRSYVHETGSLGNSHFLAIPYNSSAKEAAKVFINFLLSPKAQALKNDPAIWGDPTVLAMEKLSERDGEIFANISYGKATLRGSELGNIFPEPHSSWVEKLEETWLERYYSY